VERLYSFGSDDVIRVAEDAQLIRRLEALPAKDLLTTSERGMAVVADADHGRCDVFGRVLLNAGYDVKFALEEEALRYYTQQNRPVLVVANADVAPARKLIEEARARGCDAVWIVTSSRRDLATHADALLGLERVTVVAVTAPPESVLFSSNELLRPSRAPSRAGERVLYGTVVAFRPVGADVDDFGFSYNISRSGVYVRTLAPPEAEQVWIDLRPPRCKERVKLEGRVAWRRFFDPSAAANGPPGFGVEISVGLGKSQELWQKHADAFVRPLRGGTKALAALLEETLKAENTSQIAAIPVSLRPAAMAPNPTKPDAAEPSSALATSTPSPPQRMVLLLVALVLVLGAALTAAFFLELGPFARH
jgi:hypothetical protein